MKLGLVSARLLIDSYDFPKPVLDEAFNIYERLFVKGLTRGRSKELLVKACLFISARFNDYPIKMTDLKGIIRNVKFIKRVLELKVEFISPSFYVTRYASELGLSESELTIALEKLKIVPNYRPESLAVACLSSFASIRELARVSGLSKNHVASVVRLFRD